jgi:D-threo-aldose 1-dehydrogenase
MNQWQALAGFARDADFDCFLLAGRYNLLDQSGLDVLLPLCERKGISVVLGGPYASGILASDLSPGARYQYAEAPPAIVERARRIKAVCDRHDVPLTAAALQFGLHHPAVAAVVPGARSAQEVEENVRMARYPVPPQLWQELRREGLIADDAPTPGWRAR